jgi:4-hydroxy-3-polyprenylbenzoate decarboxylase
MSALAEMMAARYPGEEPALLFDNIPGFPKRFRVLSAAANSCKRLAHVLGLE